MHCPRPNNHSQHCKSEHMWRALERVPSICFTIWTVSSKAWLCELVKVDWCLLVSACRNERWRQYDVCRMSGSLFSVCQQTNIWYANRFFWCCINIWPCYCSILPLCGLQTLTERSVVQFKCNLSFSSRHLDFIQNTNKMRVMFWVSVLTSHISILGTVLHLQREIKVMLSFWCIISFIFTVVLTLLLWQWF